MNLLTKCWQARLLKKKYANHSVAISSAYTEELAGTLVWSSTWQNILGLGPSLRQARAYIHRLLPRVKPLAVPRQDTTISKFSDRNRDDYIFEKIPSGSNDVSWDGAFGFDVTLLEERSEPKWT